MTRNALRLALVQMTSTQRREANLSRAESLIREAASEGAEFVALPENFSDLRAADGAGPTPEPIEGEIVARFGGIAREQGIWLLLGSIPEPSAMPPRTYNSSVLLRADGTVAAVYRKIHLFDASIPGAGNLRESDFIAPGHEVVSADTPWGRVGLTICYDLRFPELFRALAFGGAELILVPSAFTAQTGPPHWEPLLRARAIENQCFIAAPAQTGRHSPTRASHGHSMVVDPWGQIIGERPQGEGILSVVVERKRIGEVRRALPCLEHSRVWLRAGPAAEGGSRTSRGGSAGPSAELFSQSDEGGKG